MGNEKVSDEKAEALILGLKLGDVLEMQPLAASLSQEKTVAVLTELKPGAQWIFDLTWYGIYVKTLVVTATKEGLIFEEKN